MQLLGKVVLLGAVANAMPTFDGVIQTDVFSKLGRRFVIRQNAPPTVKRANQIIPVVVGGPQDLYVPNVVTAAVGDIVQFQFSNGNHTATESAQDQACQALQLTVPTAVHSGHIPFKDGDQVVGTFNLVVTSLDPKFIFCATGPHCQEGQVMVINPGTPTQVVEYAKLSMSTTGSTDGVAVVGGSVGTIPLANAAFVPAPVGAPGGAPATPPATGDGAAPAGDGAAPAGDGATSVGDGSTPPAGNEGTGVPAVIDPATGVPAVIISIP